MVIFRFCEMTLEYCMRLKFFGCPQIVSNNKSVFKPPIKHEITTTSKSYKYIPKKKK